MRLSFVALFATLSFSSYSQTITSRWGDFVPSFYTGCATECIVKLVPETKAAVGLTAPATAASIEVLDGATFRIVPLSGSELHLSVTIDNKVISTETFRVKAVPYPVAKLIVDGKPVEPGTGVSAKTNRVLKIIPDIMDLEFVRSCPADSKFKVNRMTIMPEGVAPVLIPADSIELGKFNFANSETLMISNVAVSRSTWDGKTAAVNGSKMSMAIRVGK